MGKAKKHSPAKLIIGFIFKEEASFKKAEVFLKKRFGEVDFRSQPLPFEHTNYYENEFGSGLKRRFISFRKLIHPKELARIKLFTNKIEDKISKNGCRSSGFAARRVINIDPGYLELGKVILATTKDHKHRIYLDRGIYAEVTLFYENKSFRPWPWTYPDYKSDEYIKIFNCIRDIYIKQIKPY